MAVRVSLVLHEGSEIEANAARLLEDRPRRAGLTKSQYIARCIVAAEEGGLATLSVDQVRAPWLSRRTASKCSRYGSTLSGISIVEGVP